MTFDEFIHKYTNKYVDFDGVYPGECMDLMNKYCVEVLGDTSGQLRAPTAYLSFVKGGPDYERFLYKSGMKPEKGDIIYWANTYVPNTGHVAMVIESDVLTVFGQNWPEGSSAHIQKHSYNGIVGWLRYKKKDSTIINNNEEDMPRREELHNKFTLCSVKDFPGSGSTNVFVVSFNDRSKGYWEVKTEDIEETVNLFHGEIDTTQKFSGLGPRKQDWGGFWDANQAAKNWPEILKF